MTDEAYKAWVRRQPSCISSQFGEYINGEGRCEYAHVRRAKDSGTGYKPLFSGVPLTHAEHAMQHQKGEAYTLAAHGIIADDAKVWFEQKAVEYLSKWEGIYGVQERGKSS